MFKVEKLKLECLPLMSVTKTKLHFQVHNYNNQTAQRKSHHKSMRMNIMWNYGNFYLTKRYNFYFKHGYLNLPITSWKIAQVLHVKYLSKSQQTWELSQITFSQIQVHALAHQKIVINIYHWIALHVHVYCISFIHCVKNTIYNADHWLKKYSA